MQHILNQMPTTTLLKIQAVSKAGKLAKGTWNGCVFNKIGDEYGIKVSSGKAACAVSPLAAEFISYWDSHAEYTTRELHIDVTNVLAERDDIPQEFEEVNMGRVKAVRRRSIAKSNHLTLEDLDLNFEDELEALLV